MCRCAGCYLQIWRLAVSQLQSSVPNNIQAIAWCNDYQFANIQYRMSWKCICCKYYVYIDDLAQDCSNSIVNSLELLQSHTMDMLWEKFQWILPLYMKPISFQSKASVVCSVTAAIFIDFCLKKLNVFSQHVGQKTNEYLNSSEQIPRNWNVDQLSMLITT